MTNDQWATPTQLRPDGTNLLPFPVNALPPIIGDMAQAIATTTSTDVAMAGTSILSAVSYCFSGVYRMSAKRDHTEPLVLDTLTIAEPSFKKSSVMSLIKRPYIQFAHDWNVCVNTWRDFSRETRTFMCSMRYCTSMNRLRICISTISP